MNAKHLIEILQAAGIDMDALFAEYVAMGESASREAELQSPKFKVGDKVRFKDFMYISFADNCKVVKEVMSIDSEWVYKLVGLEGTPSQPILFYDNELMPYLPESEANRFQYELNTLVRVFESSGVIVYRYLQNGEPCYVVQVEAGNQVRVDESDIKLEEAPFAYLNRLSKPRLAKASERAKNDLINSGILSGLESEASNG